MTGSVLLNPEDYRKLRVESRQALHILGISSNPGFSDKDIIDGISGALGKTSAYSEASGPQEFSGEYFRDCLGEILGLELPPDVDEIITRFHGFAE